VRIAFVGGGVMAEALLARLLEAGLASPQEVRVGEPVPERRRTLTDRYGVPCTPDNREAVEGADLLFLAVKPQNLEEASRDLRGHLAPHQTVVSIVAGARLERLVRLLEHPRVVRVMPNTPARVGAGMSVWTARPEVPPEHREWVQRALRTLGDEVYTEEEKTVEMATALSASGPGFVFLFLEALVDAGVHIGLPRPLASRMAVQTLLGSAVMAQQTGIHPADLRNGVTSPGGTTTEGLLVLEKGAFRALVMEAVLSAYRKSLALGEEER